MLYKTIDDNPSSAHRWGLLTSVVVFDGREASFQGRLRTIRRKVRRERETGKKERKKKNKAKRFRVEPGRKVLSS